MVHYGVKYECMVGTATGTARPRRKPSRDRQGALPRRSKRQKAIRRSISLAPKMAERIDAIAAARHVSANRAIVDLLSDAITAYEKRRTAFLELADRFQKSTDPVETERLREELARMTFGN